MVPSLQWLLLLWGLQGAWAVDYEDDYEEEKVPTRRRTKQLPSNVIPQNGKCKSEMMSLCLSSVFLFLVFFLPNDALMSRSATE